MSATASGPAAAPPMDHGGARTMGLGHTVLDFSTSINPLGMHPAVRRRILESADDAVDYPDARSGALEEAAAAYAGVPAEMVVAGNGATELIHNICRYAAGRPVAVPSPGFGEYAAAAALCGSAVSSYPAYPNGLPSSIPPNGCVFVCNPSNPAGILLDRRRILEAASAAADAGSILVVDECFTEMTPGRDESVAPHIRRHDNMVVLRSLTKSFGLAGLRVGYCIADPAMSAELRRIRIPWSVNALAQAAGIEALAHPEHLEAARRMIRREVGRLHGAMEGMPGVSPHNTDANYLVARTEESAPDMVRRLLGLNVLVRDCSSFGMGHHIRISAKTPDKNKILLEALGRSCRA